MNDKCLLEKGMPRASTVIRVNIDAAKQVFEWAEKCGRPASEIASQLILWAAERAEIVERTHYEMKLKGGE